jgi:hypothetical protein
MDISHFSVRDIDSETEEADERERFIENLKTQFTFKHFWDYHPTQKILKSEHLQEFMNGAGRDINAFNSIEREFCKRHQASIFAFRDNTNGSLFESCIYNHIHKDYDIDIFYKNPEWAKSCVAYYLENKPKVKKKIFNAPARAFKKFDWKAQTSK